MEVLQTLSVALGLAALSGLSLYLTVFSTGLAIHLGWLHLANQYSSLSILGEPPVLIISGVLFALEFFADKIPWVDSIWDAIHTLIRPIGGALLAARAFGSTSPLFDVLVALMGGTMSFASHSVKTGTRLMVNSSPEPFSNIAVSSAENVFVIGVVALLWHYPVWVFICLVVLLAVAFYFLPKIWRSIWIRLWFIARKLNYRPSRRPVETLPHRLPGRYETVLRRLTNSEVTVKWAVPCISGKGKFLEPNRFGYLVASNEEPGKVYFITKKLIGGASKRLEILDFDVFLERRLLHEELSFYSSGKHQRFTFKFDRGSSDVAAKLLANIQAQIAAAKPLELAPHSPQE
jgi:hypothetical protein